MPIDIRSEQVLSFTAASKLPCFAYRRSGKRINVSTLWRWATAGVRGVKLETIMAGGSRVTSLEAIERFFEVLTAQSESQPAPPSPRLTRQRTMRIKQAERRLAAAGV
jgi:hypothetical protein